MTEEEHRYFILNKPYNMVSQFVSSHELPLLCDLDFDFPEGTHAIGRLDKNSEGLLLLTTDKRITRLLFQGEKAHERTYLVQVVHAMTEEHVEKLKNGILISGKNDIDYLTQKCKIKIIEKPKNLWESRSPLHTNVSNNWVEITLTEGKFHQIRKMVNALYYRCNRLIRISIEGIELGDIAPGEVKEIGEAEFFELLKL